MKKVIEDFRIDKVCNRYSVVVSNHKLVGLGNYATVSRARSAVRKYNRSIIKENKTEVIVESNPVRLMIMAIKNDIVIKYSTKKTSFSMRKDMLRDYKTNNGVVLYDKVIEKSEMEAKRKEIYALGHSTFIWKIENMKESTFKYIMKNR